MFHVCTDVQSEELYILKIISFDISGRLFNCSLACLSRSDAKLKSVAVMLVH